MRSSLLRMKSSQVVRATDCQCTSCNGPGFDPSIRRHSGIWGAADEAVLNIVRKNKKKSPQKIFKRKNISWKSHQHAARLLLSGHPETVRKRQAVWPVHHVQNYTCWVTLLQPARRAAVLDQPSSLWPHWPTHKYMLVHFYLWVLEVLGYYGS